MIKINGVDMPTPTELTWSKSDIDSSKSGRAADGKMHRDRIGSKVKLNLKWNFLSDADMSKLLKAVLPTFFNCTYPDAETGVSETKTFYVGDRSTPAYAAQGGVCGWSGVEMNFIEQ